MFVLYRETSETLPNEMIKIEPPSTSESEQNENATASTQVSSNQINRQPSANDYENDPEAGPSGLNTQSISLFDNARNSFRYPDTSDDESDEDREIAASLWRSREAYNATAKGANHDIPWRLRQNSPANFTAPANKTQSDEYRMADVVDLSEPENNEVAPADAPSPQRSGGMEILTAPDLQLDWSSDTSSDDEIICTTDIPDSPVVPPQNQNEPLNYSTRCDDEDEDLGIVLLPDESPIDLTLSDEDETTNILPEDLGGYRPQRYPYDDFFFIMPYFPMQSEMFASAETQICFDNIYLFFP